MYISILETANPSHERIEKHEAYRTSELNLSSGDVNLSIVSYTTTLKCNP